VQSEALIRGIMFFDTAELEPLYVSRILQSASLFQ
jgi:hypothetical protein